MKVTTPQAARLYEALETLLGEEDEECCEELRERVRVLEDLRQKDRTDFLEFEAKIDHRIRRLERTLGQRIRGWLRG